MTRPLVWAALAVLLAGCSGRAMTAKPAPGFPPEARAANATRIAVVDLTRVARVHPRWPEVAALDRQISVLQAKLALASDPRLSAVRIEIPRVDLTPGMKAAVERMRPEFQHEVEVVRAAARAELDAYAAQVRADQQQQLVAKRAALEAQMTKAIQEKRDALDKDGQQYQQQLLAEYRLPILNLKLKMENVQPSARGDAEKLNEQLQALTKERDEKIAAREKSNQEALQEFQKAQIQQSNDELAALSAQFNKEGQRLVDARAAEITARVRAQLEATQAEFNQRLRGQQEAIVNSARATQSQAVAQAQAQARAEAERIRALQDQLLTVERDRTRLYALILAAARVEAAGLAQERKWDVVLTQAISAPGAFDATDELIARIRR